MGLKIYRPTTPSRRFMVGYDFSDLTAKRPEKNLTTPLVSTGGRNNKGRITSRFRGGGHKKLYRIIDFRGYDKLDIPAKVIAVEYDPNRASRIALIQYTDGEKRYVLARKGSQIGDPVITGPAAQIKDGSRKQLKDIPEGLKVFNIELTPFTKGKLAKSAGNYALVAGRDEAQGIVYLKLPSGEMRKFNEKCWATLGQLGNEEHKNIVIGKAGRMRWLGFKPRNNGLNMNPVDHPHGGGEGKVGIGLKHKKAFNGRIVDPGIKTRKSKKWSTKFIVSRRNEKTGGVK